MRKYAGKKVCLNRELNSQPPGHESDMLITEPPGGAGKFKSWDQALHTTNLASRSDNHIFKHLTRVLISIDPFPNDKF